MTKTSFCHYFNEMLCGSCTWIELSYEAQVARKEKTLTEALSFFGEITLEESKHSPPVGFRNRAKLAVLGTSEKSVIGLVGDDHLDQGQELLSCPIHNPQINELIEKLPAYISEFNLIPYVIAERKGELKGLIIFYSAQANEMYLRFVLRSQECVSRLRKLRPKLQREFPHLVCVTANIQPVPHAILEGKEEIFISERKSIRHQLGKISFELSPHGFVQTNSHVAQALYETAARWVGEAQAEKLLELYSGQGAFSFFCATQVPQILGIEINPDSILTANQSAAALGLKNVRFQCLGTERSEAITLDFNPDLILTNPPRRGMGESVELILKAKPKDFLYSSCSQLTLATDLKILAKEYVLHRTKLFDMFPHTEHFETLVWLKRKAL